MKHKKLTLTISAVMALCIVTYLYLSYSNSYNKAINTAAMESKPQASNIKSSNDTAKIEQSKPAADKLPDNTDIASETVNADTKSDSENSQPAAQPKQETQPAKAEEPKQETEQIKAEEPKQESEPVKEAEPEPVSPEELMNTIVSKYQVRFSALKSESISALNGLVAQAKAEYNSVPDNKKTMAKFSLGIKYFKLGQALESECDSKFYALVSEMESELKSNNLPTNAVADAKNQYNAEKKERRSALLSKAF